MPKQKKYKTHEELVEAQRNRSRLHSTARAELNNRINFLEAKVNQLHRLLMLFGGPKFKHYADQIPAQSDTFSKEGELKFYRDQVG